MERIMVTIKDGKVEIEVEGVKGVRCAELTRGIEQLLGNNGARVLKQDYFRPNEVRQKIGVKNCTSSLFERKIK